VLRLPDDGFITRNLLIMGRSQSNLHTHIMAKLNFKNEDLQRLLSIANSTTEHRCSWSDAIKKYERTGKKYDYSIELSDEFYQTTTASFQLVKDEGIYLMTSAKMEIYPTDHSHIAYAVGYDPRQGDVWEKCRQAVGGDDFVESFEITKQIVEFIEKGFSMRIDFSPNHYNIEMIAPKKAKNAK
jgi:hypothetical protein